MAIHRYEAKYWHERKGKYEVLEVSALTAADALVQLRLMLAGDSLHAEVRLHGLHPICEEPCHISSER